MNCIDVSFPGLELSYSRLCRSLESRIGQSVGNLGPSLLRSAHYCGESPFRDPLETLQIIVRSDISPALNLYKMRLFSLILMAGCAYSADVPGKAFNRFITIWLENQVRETSVSILQGPSLMA